MNRLKILISNSKSVSDFSKWPKLIKRNHSTEKPSSPKEYSSEKREEWNILKAFASKKNSFLELHKYNPFQVTNERLRMWKMRMNRDAELWDQKFIEERHSILGNDLATSHFIVFRGGRVKFLGQSKWIQKDKDDDNFQGLPKTMVDGWYLESVDASGLPLRYEAFDNIKGLYELKTLILRGCPHIDDWCVDRISCEFHETLEHLDLSDCNLVTANALSCIYRFKKLKTLKLNNIVNSRSFEFSCLLLEEAFPQLSIEGVNYLEIPEEQNDKT